jgi:hypothetical protein
MFTTAAAQIHWWGVLASVVVFAVLGFVWFSTLFAGAYRRALGRPDDAPAPAGALPIAGPLVLSVVIVVTTAFLQRAVGLGVGAPAIGAALLLGLVIGVGYLAAMTFTIAINPNFPHPLRYGAISSAYYLIGISVASVLLVLLP